MPCGIRADEALAYQTLKIVQIKDYRLGSLYYSLVFAILCWVVGYQILYSNDHFEKLDVIGTAALTIQHPTLNGCNPNDPTCESDFRSLTELSYCDNYQGNEIAVSRRPCIFADRHTMNPYGTVEDRLLVPTRMDRTTERKLCVPSAANGFTCKNEFETLKDGKLTYVADIERSTVKIEHSFGRNNLAGDSPDVQGSIQMCADAEHPESDPRVEVLAEGQRPCTSGLILKPMECLTSSCPFLAQAPKKVVMGVGLTQVRNLAEQHSSRSPTLSTLQRRVAGGEGMVGASPVDGEETKEEKIARLRKEGVYRIREGDVFSVAKLLELAGVSLDRTLNRDGLPLRASGTVIEINVIYSNMHPFSSTFGNKHITYYYEIKARPVSEFKTELLAAGTAYQEGFRTIENRHGILLHISVGGQVGLFSTMYLLIMLTTALGLLAGATFMTDKLALFYLKDEKHLKAMIDSTECMNKGSEPDPRISQTDASSSEPQLSQTDASSSGAPVSQRDASATQVVLLPGVASVA